LIYLLLASFQNRDNFVRLLENAMRAEVPQWKANEKIVDKIVRLYASRVLLCATPEQSLSLYQEVESLPQTTTIDLLNQLCDIQLNGIFCFNTKSTLINALHNGVPAIFKIGRSIEEAKREYDTLQAVLQHHQSTAQSLSLVNIEFVEIDQLQFLVTERYGQENDRISVRFGLIMPKYALVLSQFQLLKLDHVVKWLTQIKMALVKLHEANYAHNDVKPENIFVDQNGDAFLGDFGGLAKIGNQMHEFSHVFQPSDSDHRSTVENDFYSLALSALAMMNIYPPDGKRCLSKEEIKMKIEGHSQLKQIFRDAPI
jgi:serine/threonine protein kinase